MKRVRGRGRNLGVDPGGSQAERCVNRIVVGVNQLVDRARMLGILGEHLLDDAGAAHVGSKIPVLAGRAQDGHSVETGCFQIIGKLAGEPSHGVRVGLGSRFLIALAEEESLDGSQVTFFPVRWALF